MAKRDQSIQKLHRLKNREENRENKMRALRKHRKTPVKMNLSQKEAKLEGRPKLPPPPGTVTDRVKHR